MDQSTCGAEQDIKKEEVIMYIKLLSFTKQLTKDEPVIGEENIGHLR